jgi:hypothetical protein
MMIGMSECEEVGSEERRVELMERENRTAGQTNGL